MDLVLIAALMCGLDAAPASSRGSTIEQAARGIQEALRTRDEAAFLKFFGSGGAVPDNAGAPPAEASG